MLTCRSFCKKREFEWSQTMNALPSSETCKIQHGIDDLWIRVLNRCLSGELKKLWIEVFNDMFITISGWLRRGELKWWGFACKSLQTFIFSLSSSRLNLIAMKYSVSFRLVTVAGEHSLVFTVDLLSPILWIGSNNTCETLGVMSAEIHRIRLQSYLNNSQIYCHFKFTIISNLWKHNFTIKFLVFK